ncbi:MAG TPA: 4Fe-4S dicluster domain-containing protein [Candidatus Latescibacteria bacterium]|nr:4Fe-4S dicluster domain-containing protein [Candidatus Latescibacterota bacterium]
MADITIDTERCKGCGLCVANCPLGLLLISDRLNSFGYNPATVASNERCTGCQNCAVICPDLAITIEK